ncbi:hypothetical protein [Neobacillus cucumis]|uniref:hypothetical protein n=1 Tax=Neobacillus cucumis TaxID=1740721 RepID=UPI002E212734|nr:hypothetical protein [Neobacillus cucumis]
MERLRTNIVQNVESLETDINNQKGRVDSIITDHQSKFIEEQGTRLQQFADGQKARDDAFRKSEDDRQQEFEGNQFSWAKMFENEQLKLQKDAQATLDEIAALKDKAEEIVTIITNSGLAGAYDQTSKGERTASWIWQGLAVVILGVILGFGYKYILEVSHPLTWTQLISRMFLSGVGVTLFGYCAKQSANHRLEQKRNRDIALQFASLDPFIGRFSEPVQEEIKIKLIDRYFGEQHTEVQTQQQVPSELLSNPEFLKACGDLIQRFIPKQ